MAKGIYHQELVDLFLHGKDIEDVLLFVKQKIGNMLNEEDAMKKIKLIKCKTRLRYKECHRKYTIFKHKYSVWLRSAIKFVEHRRDARKRRVGRPKKSFANVCRKNQTKRTQLIRHSIPLAQLTQATVSSVRSSGNKDVAWVIDFLVQHPEKATSVRHFLEADSSVQSDRMTINDALHFFCENDLSKRQYQGIRMMSLSKGSDIYPTYNEICEGKELCYPKDIMIHPSYAEVPLQSLLDHTIKRLFESQIKAVSPYLGQPGHFSLVSKWGLDGCSNQKQYKMPFNAEVDGELRAYSDSHIFLVCLVPLRIYFHPNPETSELVWNNDLPSSVSLCRPIRMIFEKETAALTKREVDRVKDQLNKLKPTTFQVTGSEVLVKSEMILSMMDGKVINDLTGTSSQACHLCGASGKALSLPVTEQLADNPAEYEMLPILHTWIRSMEFLLNISYRIPLGKWRINKGNEEFKLRQQTIRAEFKKIGLRISEPLPSGGNSNDDNTARRFFLRNQKPQHLSQG